MISKNITQTKIAKLFNVHVGTINAIHKKRTWAFVKENDVA